MSTETPLIITIEPGVTHRGWLSSHLALAASTTVAASAVAIPTTVRSRIEGVCYHSTYVCQLLEFLKRADGVALNRDQVIHERQLAIRARKHAHVGKWYPAPVS